MAPGTAFLMYHELSVPGRATCRPEPGYTRYVVPATDFRTQMKGLADEGWKGRNVTEALANFDGKSVCITFDDGCETDLLSAAPVLKELGFHGTSYITVEFLNRPGYLTHSQVRELSAMGLEIGCHSLTHPYLTDVDDAQLRKETAGAKERLEQIAGVRVDHYSCPGGRWDGRVAAAVKRSNFRTMATSVTSLNFSTTDHFALARLAVLDGVSIDRLLRACRGEGLLLTQMKEKTRDLARRILGNQGYDSVRTLILGKERQPESRAD